MYWDLVSSWRALHTLEIVQERVFDDASSIEWWYSFSYSRSTLSRRSRIHGLSKASRFTILGDLLGTHWNLVNYWRLVGNYWPRSGWKPDSYWSLVHRLLKLYEIPCRKFVDRWSLMDYLGSWPATEFFKRWFPSETSNTHFSGIDKD